MPSFRSAFILSLLLLLIASCTREVRVEKRERREKGIIYLKTISTLDDFGIKPSLFKRIWLVLTGGEEEGLFHFPMDIAFYENKLVAVADSGVSGIHLIDLKRGRYKLIENACGVKLISPVSCSFINEVFLAITDPGNKLLCFINLMGQSDVKPEIELLHPVGVTVDSTGDILVLDSHLHLLFKLSGDGKEVWHKGGRGEKDENLNFPTYLAYQNGKIFVVDTLSYAVKIFDDNGEFLSRFGQAGDGTGDFGKPKGIAVDKNGNIHVVDSLFDVVQVFDLSGNFLTWYGGPGEKEGNLLHPTGIKIIDNNIYVVNSLNARIEVYRYEE